MNTRKLSLLMVAVILLVATMQSVLAQVPRTISYQGKINQGSIPVSGAHLLHIAFYDAEIGGNKLYEESHQPEIVEGLFSIIIGSVTPIPDALAFDRQYYLSITIDGGQELLPRTKLSSTPYALNSHFAELAQGLTSDAHGVVTSINEVSGSIRLMGDSTTSISQTGNIITIHSVGGGGSGSSGIQSISSPDNTIAITGSNGPLATVGVADSAITTAKLANKSVTLSKLNQSGAKPGQTLRWNGAAWIAVDTSVGGISSGTIDNSTLRWDGTHWKENKNVLSDVSGNTTIKGSSTLGDGSGSDDILLQPGSGSIKVQNFGQGIVKSTSVGTLFVGTVDLGNEVVGILPVNNGGTGLNNLPTGQLLIGNGKNPVTTATLKAGAGIGLVTTPGFITINNTDTPQWKLLGNLNVDPVTQFLGTTDGNPLIIRTNNLERLRVDGAGKIGIGTTTPSQLVEVKNGNVLISNSANAGSLLIAAPGSTNTTSFTTSAQGGNIIYKLPGTLGAANDVLTISAVAGTTATLGWMQSNSNTDWKLTGNNNTVAGTHFLGTLDNNALDLRVNNVIRLRLNPNFSLQHDIGGNVRGANSIDFQASRTAATQVASGDYSSITGGINNTVAGRFSFVGGGANNNVLADGSVVSGGEANSIVASGGYSSIGGGLADTISGAGSAIAGGQYNKIYGNLNAIPGGYGLTLTGNYTFGYLGAGPSFTTVSASNTAFLGNVNLWLGNINNTPSELRFYEAQNGGGTFPAASTNYSALKAGTQTADFIYTLPLSQPTLNQVLTTTAISGSGPYNVALGWTDGNNSSWNLTGNSGTTAGTNFLGTTDNQAFEIHVYNSYTTANQGTGRALRIEATTGAQSSPNLIGGYGGGAAPNTVQSGKVGSVISGGGASGAINYIQSNYSFIGGGVNNQTGGDWSTIGGGHSNRVGGGSSTGYEVVAGGYDNMTNGIYASILGGGSNRVNAMNGVIGGGMSNVITNGHFSSILGGLGNTVSGLYSVIVGGRSLTMSGAGSFGFFGNSVSNDRPMSVSANYTSLFGNTDLWLVNNDNAARQLRFYEANNQTSGGSFPPAGINFSSFQAGGQSVDLNYTLPTTQPSANQVLSATNITGTGPYSISLGWVDAGNGNAWNLTGNGGTTAGTNFLGTTDNQALYLQVKNGATVNNTIILNTNGSIQRDVGGSARGAYAIDLQLIRANTDHVATGQGSTLSGGKNNTAHGDGSVVAGGEANGAGGIYSTVGGGTGSLASADYTTVSGGYQNYAGGIYSSVSGGIGNQANGSRASILGGGYLRLAANSVGYNNATGTTITDLNSLSNLAYFGNINVMVGNTDNTARELQFFEPNTTYNYNGTNFTSFKAAAQSSNIIYTLPSTQPSTDQVLSATTVSGSGPYNVTLGWAEPGGNSAWNLSGNSGTTVGTNFLGTTDNKALDIRTNNIIRLRFNTNNSIQRDISGPAAGLGSIDLQALRSSAQTNSGDYSTISGGEYNTADNLAASVGGGYSNYAGGAYSTIAGGFANYITGQYSAIPGGAALTLGSYSFGFHSGTNGNVDLGSFSNVIYFGNAPVMIGNVDNAARELRFYEPNSSSTFAGANFSGFKAGAQPADFIYTLPTSQPTANQVLSATAVSGSGPYNVTLGWANNGGSNWTLTGNSGTTAGTNFLGTTDNQALDIRSNNVLRLRLNTNSSIQRDVAGNTRGSEAVDFQLTRTNASQVASGDYSVIMGGGSNIASGTRSVVLGGVANQATNFESIAGGNANLASGPRSASIGGNSNSATGDKSFTGGGNGNVAAGDASVALGGGQLTMNGDYSLGFNASFGTTGIMAVNASSVAVIGNADLWLANTKNTASQLKFFEAQSSTGTFPVAATNFSSFKAGSQTADINYLLPTTQPSADQILSATAVTGTGPYNITLGWINNSGSAWTLTGNAGTTAGTNFIGTTDNQAFEIHGYNNYGTANEGTGRMFRIEPKTGANSSPNIIGGYFGNSVGSTVVGATISGGGRTGSFENSVTANFGTVTGGYGNIASGAGAVVNGIQNTAAAAASAIGGGNLNYADGNWSSIAGGYQNSILGNYSAIVGGKNLRLGANSFGFNADVTSPGWGITYLNSVSNVAYFGNVDVMIGHSDGTPRELRFYGTSTNSTYSSLNYVALKAGTPTAVASYTLPNALPVATGNILFSGTTGAMSWSTGLVWDNTNSRLGVNTTTPSHPIHSINSATTDEVAAVYANNSGSTSNQAIGIWGDASNTATANTGTIGILGTGNGNTTAGQTNIALQVNDGEFTMGRTTEAPGTGNVVSTATGGTAYTAQGPSGIVELTLGNGNLSTAAPTASSIQNFAAITINNRYCQAGSIVLVNIVGMTDDGNAPDPRDAAFIANVDNTAAGSFSVRIKMIPSATNASNYTSNDKVKIGYVVVNASR